MSEQCEYIKAGGERCRAMRLNDAKDGMCWFHSSHNAVERSSARSRGASAHKLSVTLDEPTKMMLSEPVASPQDVAELLANCMQAVIQSGVISPKSAASIAFISEKYLKALEAGKMADRIAELERKLKELQDT